MKKILTAVVFGVVTLVLCTTSQAALVVIGEVVIDPAGPGTFDILLSTPVGESEGIVSYAVTMEGPILGWEHNSPVASFATPGNASAGFGFVRSPGSIVGEDGNGPGIFSAAQNAGPGGNKNLIAGFGQIASDFAAEGITVLVAGDEPQSWNVPLLVLSGQYEPGSDRPSINYDASSATVWTQFNGVNDAGVIAEAPVVPIPEPAAIALACFGLIGIVTLRRR